MGKIILRCFTLGTCLCFFQCLTGSNYEKLAARAKVLPEPEVAGNSPVSIVIRPLEISGETRRVETFRKGFLMPGYLGIDYDIYGRPGPEDERSGMRTIYSLADAHGLLAAELNNLEVKATPASAEIPVDAEILDITILGSETSLRIHTYGCWPFAGTVMYIINRDIYSVVTETRLEYKLENARGVLKKGTATVLSESKFSFWGSYAGAAILESYDEALAAHLKDVARRLVTEIRNR